MTTDCVVAVDVGTSAVRAALISGGGEVLTQSRVERFSAVGGEFFDAEALLGEVVAALASLKGGPEPLAVCISAHIGTVAIGADRRAVDDGGGWADPRGLPQLHGLPENLRADVLQASGRPAPASGALAYVLALRESPQIAARVRHLLSPKDFLIARLTGEIVTDTVDAAYTLLSDVRRRVWNASAVAALGLDPDWLPRLAEPSEVVGHLRRAAAKACHLPAGTPVVAGGPDGSVGIGLLLGTDTTSIADVAGTTDVIGRLISDPVDAPAQAAVNPALVGARWVAGGASGMTGGAVAHWRTLVGDTDDAELARIPPGADGLIVLPTMTGSRYPRWRPADRGGVLNTRPEHTTAHLVRAAQEGAGFTVREGIDVLDSPDPRTGRMPIVLAGGTARSASAAQLRADILHRTTLVCSEPEVTLLGAAALALVGSGIAADLDDARRRFPIEYRQLEPDPERAERYDELFFAWRDAREAAGHVDAYHATTGGLRS